MSEPQTPSSWSPEVKEELRRLLQSFLHDPEVSRSLEQDRPLDLYKRLLKKRKTASLADRHMLDQLLGRRRLFATPIQSAPSMVTFNGIGTKLYGRSEHNEKDETYIATLFAVFVFLPIWPIACYVVRATGGLTYQFFAKVPLAAKDYLWRRIGGLGVLGTAAVIAGFAGWGLWQSFSHSDLRYVNALDVPVTIQMDKETAVKVNPGGVRSQSPIRQGKHHVITRTVSGELVEEFDTDVPFAKKLMVYNVLGAAPVFTEATTYYAEGTEPKNPDDVPEHPLEHFCGKRIILPREVQYVFTDFPRTIDMPKGANTTVRWRIALDKGGWQKTLRVLAGEEKLREATEIANAVARTEPENEEAVGYALGYTRASRGNDAAIEQARDLLKRAPESLALHRAYQSYVLRTDKAEACRALYRKLHAEHPDSVMYGYLHARVELPLQAKPLYADLVQRNPDDPYVRRGFAHTLFQLRQFAEAFPHFEKFTALDPKGADALLDEHVRTLVALGRASEAAKLAAEQCRQTITTKRFRNDLLILYGKLARLAPDAGAAQPPDKLLQEFVGDENPDATTRVWYLSYTDPDRLDDGLLNAVTNVPLRTAAVIMRDIASNPDNALKLARELPDDQLDRLNDPTLLLLACECVNGNDKKQAERLLNAMSENGREVSSLRQHVLSGTDLPELTELDLELQAALHVAQARRLAASGRPATEKYDQALKDDLLQGTVTRVARRERK